MPVHNTGPYLEDALKSIFSQTFQDWELLVLDDGSTDHSREILEKLAQGEPRLRVLAREYRGVVTTRNELMAAARAPLLAWMDSDDHSVPERLALQVQRMREEPELVCLGGAWLMTDPEGLPIRIFDFPTDHEDILKAMEEEIAIGFGASMMRRDSAMAVGGFREPFVISEDYDLCLRLSEVGRVANLPEVILHYRQHMGSTVNAGRPRSSTYSRLARELAWERRARGQDRLQRGEKVAVRICLVAHNKRG